jgi:peptide-methionine (S)-S-oxide reductase
MRRTTLAVAIAALALVVLIAADAPDSPIEAKPAPAERAVAIFAGGCFWCMEPPFDALPGVISTTSGYTGGTVPNPTYAQVSSGETGHLEAVQVEYDPKLVSYSQLLDVFWHNVDPTDAGGQFCDRGAQYATAIFASGESQLAEATASKERLSASDVIEKPIVTPIRAAGAFYPAEDDHQDYYKKNPLRYKVYRSGCGRDAVLDELWGKDR